MPKGELSHVPRWESMINVCLIVQVVMIMIRVAFYTLLERKILGYVQSRKGPNKPGVIGLLIPFADAVKLLNKEYLTPVKRNKSLLFTVPILILMVPLILWLLYPSGFRALSIKYSALFFLCVSSLGVYGILGAGWRRNRKYAMLGSVRAVAQSVSYEVCLSIIVVHWIVFYYYETYQEKLAPLGVFLFGLIFVLWLSALAETNRRPFDFSEGESELVRGFNTEYRSVPFLMIFLAEYMSILFISILIRTLFNITLMHDLWLFLILWGILVIWARGSLPRFRYDQLMSLAWKRLLPAVTCSAGIIIML